MLKQNLTKLHKDNTYREKANTVLLLLLFPRFPKPLSMVCMRIFIFTLHSQLLKSPYCHQLFLTSGFPRTEFPQKAYRELQKELCRG